MSLCEDYKRTAGKGAIKENNLLTDRQEGGKAIDWNSYGKMSRLVKGTATEDTLTMVFHYDGMGNRIRKDVWREAPGSTGGQQDRVSDIYARDAQGNILAVYKEHAQVNGGATIDWLNSQLYQVAQSNEIATFLSSQYGSNGNFTSNLYDYGLTQSPDWAATQQSGRSGRYYINASDYMFGHALETQLAESWNQLRTIDPAEFLPLLTENEADINLTGRLVAKALQTSSASTPTLERLSNTDEDFMNTLFSNLPEEYRTYSPGEVTELGTEGRLYRLTALMDAQGAAPIGDDAFAQAAKTVAAAPFLADWLYDEKVFSSSSLGEHYDLKMALRQSIIKSENEAALAVVRDQFGNWMDAELPGYFEESFTAQDRLNVIYNSDKVVFLESFINELGMQGVTAGLVQIPGLTGLSYSNTIISGVSLGLLNPAILQYVNTPSPQNIDTDSLWLAEHHLYGSSRLGIKQYEPQQYRNVYSNTDPFVKGINVKQPWYSLSSEDMIKSGTKALPLLSSHYLVDTFRYKRDLGTKYYELSDHLGNVLATVLDRKTGYGAANGEYAGFRADIASATDYSPFGFQIAERTLGGSNRFGFNGQEKDNEVKGVGNSLDFTARMYDTRVGRFLSLDPMSKKFPSESNFSFAGNNPIYYVDREGKYKISADRIASYREKFPHIVAYFENQINADIMKSQTIIDGITMHQKYSKNYSPELSKKYVDYITTWDQGPEIIFDEDFGWPLLPEGEFIPENNVIMLRESSALALEKILASDVSSDKKMIAFFRFFKTVVHKSGHRANYPGYKVGFDDNTVYKVQDRFNKNSLEAGFDTELFIWGNDKMNPFFTDFTSDNAIQMIINNAKQTEEGLSTLPSLPKLPPAAKPNKNENVD